MNLTQLQRHFSEHGADFGASNASDYEAQADVFLSGKLPAGIQECTRKKGDIMRYDPKTEACGVLDNGGVIRTFFKPVPCSKVPASVRAAIKMSGRCHGHPNNLAYFQAECRKW